MDVQIVIWKEGHKVARVSEPDAPYGHDNFMGEPHCEAVTVKFTPAMKEKLAEFARVEGFTSMGPAVHELLMVGLKYWPVEVYQATESKRQEVADNPIVKAFLRT